MLKKNYKSLVKYVNLGAEMPDPYSDPQHNRTTQPLTWRAPE